MSWEIAGSLYESRTDAADAYVDAYVSPCGDTSAALAWLDRPNAVLVAEIDEHWPRAEDAARTHGAQCAADFDDDDLCDAFDRLRERLTQGGA